MISASNRATRPENGLKRKQIFTDVLHLFDLISDSESSIAICEYLFSISKTPEDKITWLQCIAPLFPF